MIFDSADIDEGNVRIGKLREQFPKLNDNLLAAVILRRIQEGN